MLKITYEEMLDQLKKITSYYFFDQNFAQNIIMPIFERMENEEIQNADVYASQYEEETDKFIHKLVAYVDGDREKSIKLVNGADENILYAIVVRLTAFEDYCKRNPHQVHLMLGDTNAQLVVDCLINFWRAYRQDSPIIF